MILLSNNHEKNQGLPEEIEQRNSYCFFAYSFTLHEDDDEELKVTERKRYKDSIHNSKCVSAELVNYEKQMEYIWDGYEERTLEIGPTDETERRLIRALIYLNSKAAEKEHHNICKQYDYAWIYKAIKKKLFMGSDKFSFTGVPEYVDYIKEIVDKYKLKKGIGDSDNIRLYYNKADGNTLPWDFKGCTIEENNRRNDIVKEFIERMDPTKY